MKKTIFHFAFFLCVFASAYAQDKPASPKGGTIDASQVAGSGSGSDKISGNADIAFKIDLPAHATFTAEETAKLRIAQLRAEKLSVQVGALQAQLATLNAQLKAANDGLELDFKAVAEKHGIPPDKATTDYDVINGESGSDRPVLLKRKSKPADQPKAPAPPK